jgi:Chlorophyll A-B binding protein
MKTAVLFSLVAGAAAFVPAQKAATTTQLADAGKAAFGSEIGAQAPLGYWDPLGFCKEGDKETFERLRWVELKHGRVAMLAVVGYLVTYAGVRFPGAEDIPAGFAALDNLPGMVWAQAIATWAMMEAANQDQSKAPWGTAQGSIAFKADFKGDFRNGFIDFGWDKQSAAWKDKKRATELNQGRAAQMGILGLMVHEKLGNVADILP